MTIAIGSDSCISLTMIISTSIDKDEAYSQDGSPSIMQKRRLQLTVRPPLRLEF